MTVNRGLKGFTVHFLPVIETVHLMGQGGKEMVLLRAEDHLFSKLFHQPLAKNMVADVWFQAVVNCLTRDEFVTDETIVGFSYRDVATGTDHTISGPNGGQSWQPLDLDKLSRETR